MQGMQKLMSRMRSACEHYNMISEGDKIAVALSGGKDSTAMLIALDRMRSFYPVHYDIVALTVDMRFDGVDGDYEALTQLCLSRGIEYHIIPTNLAQIIFDVRKEKNPCSLCAKMRRGILHNAAKEYSCNKIALGHHMDDAVETFLMNLLNGAAIDCFSPVTYLSRRELYVIRPMIFASESIVAGAARHEGLPVVKSKCPRDGRSERAETKALVASLNKRYPQLREKIIEAMQKGSIAGW